MTAAGDFSGIANSSGQDDVVVDLERFENDETLPDFPAATLDFNQRILNPRDHMQRRLPFRRGAVNSDGRFGGGRPLRGAGNDDVSKQAGFAERLILPE